MIVWVLREVGVGLPWSMRVQTMFKLKLEVEVNLEDQRLTVVEHADR